MTTARFDIVLPDYVVHTLRVIEDAGFEAWCVGGGVRDALLNRDVHDYDIATSAPWQAAEEAFLRQNIPVHHTGTKHGTITAVVQDHAIEITTYRVDGTYSDGRRPDSVEFTQSIEEDLIRRDFTINALAYHPDRGVLDSCNGLNDLEQGIIRAVGDPGKRFTEDGLRILRGCRFASQLGFSIEPKTLEAMKTFKMRLSKVSAERITHEMDALLLGNHVYDALMESIDVLGAIMPEIVACKGFDQHTPYHIYDVWEHTAWVVQRTPATRLGRWAALFHDIGKPAACFMEGERAHFFGHAKLSVVLARSIMQRLLFSPAFTSRVLTLVRAHDDTIAATPKSVRRALARLDGDVELFDTLCDLKLADALAHSSLSEPRIQLARELKQVLVDVIEQQDAFTIKQLAINGDDVMALGVPAGPAVGEALEAALDAVIDEHVPNERAALLEFLRKR